MATFRLTAPGGAQYEVDAPDEGAAVNALQKLIGRPEQGAQGWPIRRYPDER